MISEKSVLTSGSDNGIISTAPAMRKTPLLCQVTDPEDKRRIVGDTFMRVANEVNVLGHFEFGPPPENHSLKPYYNLLLFLLHCKFSGDRRP